MTAAKVLSGSLSNYLRLAIQIGVQLWTTPMILNGVGKDVYAIWALVFSVLSIVGILEFGVGAGAVKYAAEHRGTGDTGRRNRGLSTLLALSFACSGFAVVVLLLGYFIGPKVFGLKDDLASTMRVVFVLLGLRYTVLLWPLSLFQGVLYGQARIGTINLVQIVTNLLYGFACWLSIHMGWGIVGVAAANLTTMLLEYGSYWVLASRTTDELILNPANFDRSIMSDAGKLALSQLIVTASGLILLRTDPIIIQGFLSLAAVSTYAVALRISESAFLLVKQFINVLSPHIAALYAKGDAAGIRRLFTVSTRYALVPAVMITCPIMVYSRDLLVLWIGPSVADGGPVLAILCLAMALMTPQVVASSFLTYTGRYLHTSKPVIAGAILNVIASVICVKLFGLVGVAIGTFAAVFVADVLWVVSITLREMELNLSKFLGEGILPLLPSTVVYALVTLAIRHVLPPTSLAMIAGEGILSAAVFGAAFFVTGLRPQDKDRVLRRLKRRTA